MTNNIDVKKITQQTNRKVLLYSGGMDSYIISKIEKFDTILYINSNSKYSKAELNFLPPNTVVNNMLDLKEVELENSIVPLRNLFFVLISTFYGDEIILGATAGDRSYDKDLTFAKMSSNILSRIYMPSHWCSGREIKISLPYKNNTKLQLIQKFINNGGDIQELRDFSFSCYHPTAENKQCGECKACVRKWISMLPWVNSKDDFEVDPVLYWHANIDKIRSNVGDSTLTRGVEDLETIDIYDNLIKNKL